MSRIWLRVKELFGKQALGESKGVLLPAFNVPPTTTGQFAILVIAFGYGWGVNDAYNKVLVDWR